MDEFVYLNGDLVLRDAAVVSAFDRSFLYGDGLFETVRAYGGVPFMLAEHLERMANSAAEFGIEMPSAKMLADAARQTVRLNELTDAYVRITLSRGVHAGPLVPDEPPEPTVLIDARELHPYPPELYERGAAVIVSSFTHDSRSAVRRHKTTSYIGNILAKREAREALVDEAILLDADGHVAECATSNVFCVKSGVLITPPLDMNILPGVTRAAVIWLAGGEGIEVAEARFGVGELEAADEVFITNSLMEVMPVRTIDRRAPMRAPGPVTSILAAAYKGLVARGTGEGNRDPSLRSG